MSWTIPPLPTPDNQKHSGGFTIPPMPTNSVEVAIPKSSVRPSPPKLHDTYQGIPGDGITPG